MLEAFLEQVLAGHDSVLGLRVGDDGVAGIRVVVAAENRRSWRCLEKLGFVRDGPAREIEGEEGLQLVPTREAGGVQSLKFP